MRAAKIYLIRVMSMKKQLLLLYWPTVPLPISYTVQYFY